MKFETDKMKITTIILILLISKLGFSQFNSAFDKEEAMNMVAICNYWINGKIKDVDSTYIDSSYQLLYESSLYKMENKWQLWKKGEDAVVINMRGTTRKSISWLENFYAVMIPAEGDMLLPDSQKVHYKYAEDPRASVHVGWSMGVSFLISDILEHIKEVNEKGIYNIYITGHSQGGALAHLLRSAFEYLPDSLLSKKNKFKVYTFASPKPGNRFFAYDYARYTSLENPSYTIINSSDWVPQVPFSIQSPDNMTKPNPFASLENNDFKIPFIKRLIVKRMYNSMKNPVGKSQRRFEKKLGKKMKKQISKKVGDFETPNYVDDFAFFPVGVQVILKPWKTQSEDAIMNIFWQHLPAHYYYLIKEQL